MTASSLPENPEEDKKSSMLPGRIYAFLQQNIIPAFFLVLIIAVLYAVSKYNFALFHTAIEFSTIAIAVAIFLLVWKSRKIVQNNYLFFIGVAFVFIAILDFLHTTVYQGVGIFPGGGGTLSTRLWIAARYMQAVTLLAAPLLIRRKLRMDVIAIMYLAADIIVVASIFVFQNFPATYIESVGLTPFKIISEYIVCVMLIGAVILLYRNRESFDRQVLDNLVIAIVLTIISEIAFTEYASFVDIFSVIGHVVRLLAYYFFYRAIIEIGQEKPYNLLYRDLNESEKKYRALSDLSPDIILVHRSGTILYLNEAGLRFFGISSREEIIGKNILDYLHPDDRTAGEARITAVEERQVTVPLTDVRYVVNGRIVPAEVTAGPTLWDGLPAVQVVIRDITERRRAERAFREKEETANAILAAVKESIWLFGSDDTILLANPTALKRLGGRQPGEVIGHRFPEFMSAELATARRARIEEVISSRRAVQFEDERAGIIFDHTFYPVFDETGTIASIAAFSRDITERKWAEEALRHAYERTSTILESISDSFIAIDKDWRITYINRRALEYFNRPPEEVLGKIIWEVFPEIVGTPLESFYRKAMVSQEPVTFTNRSVVAPGRNFELHAYPMEDGLTIFGQDITDRKRAEEELLRRNEDLNAAYEEITSTQEELQQSNDELTRSEQELRKTSQYLENLINYANAPIVVWDPHFVITRFNHAFEELTGRTAREIIGQRLEVLFPQQYLDASMEIIRKTMEGERLRVVEIPILSRSGEIRIVLWNSATLFEADGITVQSTIAQGNDITERKMTEAELEERNEELNSAIEELTRQGHELNEALNEKEVLLSEVHHRVKNNLTAFISLLSLESAYDDTPAGLALKKDLQNRARSMALIHETLYRTKKYSRVNMDLYLSTLVGQVVSSYESGKSIQTTVDTNGITLDLSRATPGGLIINELLTNSLKYAFPPSFDCEKIRGAPCMITVNLIEDDGAYILTVGDNGIGLPGDFDVASTKTLGLKLVNFLARHQLRASVEVHSDHGAEFRFRFQDKV